VLPIVLLLQALAFGLALILPAARVVFRDLGELLRAILQLWMWTLRSPTRSRCCRTSTAMAGAQSTFAFIEALRVALVQGVLARAVAVAADARLGRAVRGAGRAGPGSLPLGGQGLSVTPEPVLRASGLSKRFHIYASPWVGWRNGPIAAARRCIANCGRCADVSFEIRPGQVMGVIGVNAAGKSTLVKMLTGVARRDRRIGRDPRRVLFAAGARLGTQRVTDGPPERRGQLATVGPARRLLALEAGRDQRVFRARRVFRLSGRDVLDRHAYCDSPFRCSLFLESELLIIDEVMAVVTSSSTKML